MNPTPASSLLVSLVLAGVTAGCAVRKEERPVSGSPNASILEEVDRARAWFHARKVRPIWGRTFEKDQTVETIEGLEKVKAGDYLCRGEAHPGDVWIVDRKLFDATYEAVGAER